MPARVEYEIDVKDGGTPKLKRFGKELGRANKSAGGFGKSMGGAGTAVKGFVAALAIGKIVGYAREIQKTQDAQIKLGRAVGLTAEEISGFQFAAQLGGASAENMNTALGKLSKNVLNASEGTGDAKKAFEAMGITVKDAEGNLKTTDQVLFEVSDKFKDLKDGTEKAAQAQRIFGRQGVNLVNTLNQGSDALRKQVQEGAQLSNINAENAESMEKFNDALLRLETAGKGLFSGLVVAMGPWLERLTEASSLLSENIRLTQQQNALAETETRAELKLLSIRLNVLKQAKKEGAVLSENQNKYIAFAQKRFKSESKRLGLKDEEIQALVSESSLIAQINIARKKGDEQAQSDLKKRLDTIRESTKKAQEAQTQQTTFGIKAKETAVKENDKLATEQAEKDAKRFDALIEYQAQKEDERHAERIAQREREAKRFDAVMEFEAQQEEEAHARRLEMEKEAIEAQQKRMEAMKSGMSTIGTIAGNLTQVIQRANEVQINGIKAKFDQRREQIESTAAQEMRLAQGNAQRQKEIETQLSADKARIDAQQSAEENNTRKKSFDMEKSLSTVEAVMNGAVAVTEAYATGGPILGPIMAGVVAAATAAQVGVIQSQKFAQGGMPVGSNALVTMNESGQEAVLNNTAYKAFGADFVNAANAGRIEEALDNAGRGSGGGVTVQVSGFIDKKAMVDVLIPEIKRATRNRR